MTDRFEIPGTLTRKERQADLFESECNHLSAVFVNIDDLDQEIFLRVISRNSILRIVDLRNSPVFKRPKFDHKYITMYLSRYRIPYVDIAVRISEMGSETGALEGVVQECGTADRAGSVMFVYDAVAERRERPALMRKFLRRSPVISLELNCRALAGYRHYV